MNPRESALLAAAATLLSTKQDVAYGPAHAVRDALALETEVYQQLGSRAGIFARPGGASVSALEEQMQELRKAGAL